MAKLVVTVIKQVAIERVVKHFGATAVASDDELFGYNRDRIETIYRSFEKIFAISIEQDIRTYLASTH